MLQQQPAGTAARWEQAEMEQSHPETSEWCLWAEVVRSQPWGFQRGRALTKAGTMLPTRAAPPAAPLCALGPLPGHSYQQQRLCW